MEPDQARGSMLDPLPPWANDALHVVTEIHFDWKDRIRILFGAKVVYRARVAVDVAPKQHQADRAELQVWMRPWFRKRLEMGDTCAPDKVEAP